MLAVHGAGEADLVGADGRAVEEVPAESSSTVPAGSGPCAAARLEPGGCSAMASRSCAAVHATHRQRRSSPSLVAACSGDASVLHAAAPQLVQFSSSRGIRGGPRAAPQLVQVSQSSVGAVTPASTGASTPATSDRHERRQGTSPIPDPKVPAPILSLGPDPYPAARRRTVPSSAAG